MERERHYGCKCGEYTLSIAECGPGYSIYCLACNHAGAVATTVAKAWLLWDGTDHLATFMLASTTVICKSMEGYYLGDRSLPAKLLPAKLLSAKLLSDYTDAMKETIANMVAS